MRAQSGFSYLIAMFMVAVVSLIALRAMENSLTSERREQETQLMAVGQAYQNAIRAYYLGTPGTVKRYPPDLPALLQDSRTTRITRPLRRLYWDPITASEEWGVVEAPDGGVMGVYSRSTRRPLKVDGFALEQRTFVGATTYQDWKFVYQPS